MARAASVHVLSHGYCFDGVASATLFSHLLSRLQGGPLQFAYRSCGYGPKLKVVPRAWLSGDINAILDFRYSEDERLHWYFDHHATAFASREARELAERNVAEARGRRVLHFDPEASSCVRLIADVARVHHGVDTQGLSDLVEWADRVDAARFDAPEEAFFAKHPALAFAEVVERHGDTKFLNEMVPRLLNTPFLELCQAPDISALSAPYAQTKLVFLAAVREHGHVDGEVAVVDLTSSSAQPAGKFASYVAFPQCRYAATLLRTKDQLKLGIGYNPWSGRPRGHDVAALCKREGGGGHAVVGAANFPNEALDLARAALTRVTRALNAPDD